MRIGEIMLLVLLAVLVWASCSASGPTPVRPMGTLSGTVRIGPLCPVEPCSSGINPYVSRKLLLSQIGGSLTQVPLSEDGSFKMSLPAGTYRAELSDCDFLGCAAALPVEVDVVAGEFTSIDIDIDTGIRSPAMQ